MCCKEQVSDGGQVLLLKWLLEELVEHFSALLSHLLPMSDDAELAHKHFEGRTTELRDWLAMLLL